MPLADRTYEAIVVDWDEAAVLGRRAAAADVRDRVEALCAAGVHVFVVSDAVLDDIDGQLRARPAGPGRLHLCLQRGAEVFEVGSDGATLQWRRAAAENGRTAKADSVRWAASWLAGRGITGRLVLLAGAKLVAPELARASVVSIGSGPMESAERRTTAPLVELLDAQLARRRNRRVPAIDDDPGWVVVLPEEREMARAAEAMGALANGWAGLRGAREEDGPGTAPLFTVSGIYTGGPAPQLLPGPVWSDLTVRAGDGGEPPVEQRVVDLRTGVLVRTGTGSSQLRTLRFVSAARPEALALRAEAADSHITPGNTFSSPVGDDGLERKDRGERRLARTLVPGGGGIAVAARDWQEVHDGRRVVERVAAWVARRSEPPDWEHAAARLAAVERVGFDRLLAEHREAWARRWADAEVSIEGDQQDELAARFAAFQLLSAAPDEGEAAVGARGLTGTAYGGHVFWDADVYVLPALAAIRPAAARAMLEYRVRRLPAARAAAVADGLRGARFPWESATDGTDVTPRRARGRHGEQVLIRTGEQEEHIVAAVAWAAAEYVAWTGDTTFLGGSGRDLIIDTARYWASRVRVDRDGRAHLFGLMGPDEYHEVVDDNAYTNVMARWNLCRAAQLVDQTGGDTGEAAQWRQLAAALIDGWDSARGLYEQFAGYWDLEPLLIADIAPPPVAADVLLGADRVSGSQLIKQPDVLMLHHLVPDDVVPGSLEDHLTFYEPRTTHGSSLSPAIHAALFARAGQPERALEFFRLAARLDLDDVTGTTAGGLHLATMGGVWQALAYGFLGLRPRGGVLAIDPCLPAAWKTLGLRCRFEGLAIGVRAQHDSVTISCAHPIRLRIGRRQPALCLPPGGSFALEGSDQ